MFLPEKFQQCVLDWYERQGRKDLPWQRVPSPYRVWVSEIMLQQTQVLTVIPYFQRFLDRFPSVQLLADASLDEVLHLWSGLGYYARARNLYKTAHIICEQYKGIFPSELATLQQLPGVGRSTAGAILSFGLHQRGVILDGNVKRLLARIHRIEGDLSNQKTNFFLWELVEQYTPSLGVEKYNQAMMDLGAMVCTRSKPKCLECPMKVQCLAYETNCAQDYPQKKQKRPLPQKTSVFLILQNEQGQVLLEKYPPIGIWGGLWGFPSCEEEGNVADICRRRYGYLIQQQKNLIPFRHTFSHFRLQIQPILLAVKELNDGAILLTDRQDVLWVQPEQQGKIGMPQPIIKILKAITQQVY